MTAYTYREDGLKLELFRVDRPTGRWLAFGSSPEVPGFYLVRYLDKLPSGCSKMSAEATAHRHMLVEEQLRGDSP